MLLRPLVRSPKVFGRQPNDDTLSRADFSRMKPDYVGWIGSTNQQKGHVFGASACIRSGVLEIVRNST